MAGSLSAKNYTLEEFFNTAASYVQSQSMSDESKKLDQSQLLELYGLYKSATIGPCNEQKPGIFNQKGRAKWEAWKTASSLTKEEAQETYVAKVKQFYNWNPTSSAASDESDKYSPATSFLGGNAVSTFAKPLEDDGSATQDPVFGWAKDNDITKITEWLGKGNDINIKDEDGLSLLHWVVDRGHFETCKHLIGLGANPEVLDADGQTPLDYAITCEHENLITLLQRLKELKDEKSDLINVSTTSNP